MTRRARRLGQVEHLGSAAHDAELASFLATAIGDATRRPADLRPAKFNPELLKRFYARLRLRWERLW